MILLVIIAVSSPWLQESSTGRAQKCEGSPYRYQIAIVKAVWLAFNYLLSSFLSGSRPPKSSFQAGCFVVGFIVIQADLPVSEGPHY